MKRIVIKDIKVETEFSKIKNGIFAGWSYTLKQEKDQKIYKLESPQKIGITKPKSIVTFEVCNPNSFDLKDIDLAIEASFLIAEEIVNEATYLADVARHESNPVEYVLKHSSAPKSMEFLPKEIFLDNRCVETIIGEAAAISTKLLQEPSFPADKVEPFTFAIEKCLDLTAHYIKECGKTAIRKELSSDEINSMANQLVGNKRSLR